MSKPTKGLAKECEDCGDEVPFPRRRFRCRHCKKLVCGWCYNHVHGLQLAHPSTESERE